jgi:hypothetical protein
MAEPLRRSTRTRRAPQTFEETVYAIDILHANLRGADDTMEDFLATLFLFYKPACHEPAKWHSGRGKYRSVFTLTQRRCEQAGLDASRTLNFAHAFCTGQLDTGELRAYLNTASGWSQDGIQEFERTVGIIEDEEEDAAAGEEDDEDEQGTEEDDDDEEEDGEGEEDEEDEDEDEDEDDEAEEEEEEDEEEEDGEYEASFVVDDDAEIDVEEVEEEEDES